MTKVRWHLFRAGALCLVLASGYHVAALIWRQVDPGSSATRHAAFAIINLCVAAGLWKRPKGFFWFFAALTAQQLHSHGRSLIRVLLEQHRIEWASIGVLIVLPLLLWLLWQERHAQNHEPA